jgi:cell wall-associated NlpC family hydrolase
MQTIGQAVAEAGRALVGVRFRPQGRDPAFGLDCVGFAAAALEGAGIRVPVPPSYAQRGGDRAGVAAQVDAVGLCRIDPASAAEGDLLLMETGPAQYHLAVRTHAGFVHADAGLRRVVEVPGLPRWPLICAWRPKAGEG